MYLWALWLVLVACGGDTSGWERTDVVDPMTDKKLRLMERKAVDTRDVLAFRCAENRPPELAVMPVTLPPSHKADRVRLRIDDSEAETWPVTRSGDVLYVALDMVTVGRLRSAQRVLVQYDGVGDRNVVATFAFDGFSDAFDEVTAPPCAW